MSLPFLLFIDIGLNDDTDRWKASLSRSFIRSGVASFNLGRYAEAKNCFLKGQQHQDEMGVKQWITWCNERMQKLGIKEGTEEPKEAEKPKAAEKSKLQEEQVKTDSQPLPSDSSAAKDVPAAAMPVPKIKHDWYQTEAQVYLTSKNILKLALNSYTCQSQFGCEFIKLRIYFRS